MEGRLGCPGSSSAQLDPSFPRSLAAFNSHLSEAAWEWVVKSKASRTLPFNDKIQMRTGERESRLLELFFDMRCFPPPQGDTSAGTNRCGRRFVQIDRGMICMYVERRRLLKNDGDSECVMKTSWGRGLEVGL